jgi:hypothetical protein
MKEYISTNNIYYSLLSLIVKDNLTISLGTYNFLDENLEKEIDLFLEPFKLFIKYINNDLNIDLLNIV